VYYGPPPVATWALGALIRRRPRKLEPWRARVSADDPRRGPHRLGSGRRVEINDNRKAG
jgi:hypothetical protein